jgi:two-component system sensor histidine kinase BaeS
MSLFQKGLLAFAVVIFIAVATVALLVGRRAETEFRSYAALYSNRAQMLAGVLEAYYQERGSWDGLQASLADLGIGPGRARRGSGGQGVGSGAWDYRVADGEGLVVASSAGRPEGRLTSAERQRALALEVDGFAVGYLLPDAEAMHSLMLDAPSEQFLERMWQALLAGGLVAFVAALVLAGLLTRGILAPVRALTDAAGAVAVGNLDVTAPVSGSDEIARLAQTFNQMASSLKTAEEARRAQTADIAHELRNPLAVLQGTLEALGDGVYEPTAENVGPALDQVRTLNRLVEDLRTLALADAGELRLQLQPLGLGRLLERAIEAHREGAAERGLALEADLPQEVPSIQGDYDRLTQVLGNVLSNALRYVPAGGAVRITAAADDGGVAVRIADNGPGVRAEDLPRVFDRFWRGDPSRSRGTGGSGLGLAIARRVVEAHGGRIWAEETPGGGLTIAVWLPGGEEEAAA